jgi:hypothetical protein
MGSGETMSLETKGEILKFMRCGWSRLKYLIENEKFPAVKIAGQWTADEDMINEWRQETIKKKLESIAKS